MFIKYILILLLKMYTHRHREVSWPQFGPDKDTAEIIGLPCSTVPQTFTNESLVRYSQLDFVKTEAVKAKNLRPSTSLLRLIKP